MQALEGAEAVSAAIHILKLVGFPGISVTPAGSSDARVISAQMAEMEHMAATAADEMAVSAKKKAYFRAMDDIQYGLPNLP
jgi:hypothetical protein